MDGQHDDAYKLAYDEAIRALSQQQTVLDNFRTRAGILLSGAAIATSFLGGRALEDGSLRIWSCAAISAFVAVGVSTILILWPRRHWEFAAIPRRVIDTYIEAEEPFSPPRIHRDLALHMEDSYVLNERRLERLIVLFRVASVVLTFEVVAWVVDVATRA